jgi:tetratricopeptide (TPR) repeat protein
MFPNDDNFYGYLWWIQKENLHIIDATRNLEKWLSINPKNPMINLHLWEIYIIKEDYENALEYLQNTISFDKTDDFSSIATQDLAIVKEKLKQKESETDQKNIDNTTNN